MDLPVYSLAWIIDCVQNWKQNVSYWPITLYSGLFLFYRDVCTVFIQAIQKSQWRSQNKKLSYRLETGHQQCISLCSEILGQLSCVRLNHVNLTKLLSIAVMTYSYDYHLRSPMSDDLANLLRTQWMNFSMRLQHVRMTRDPTVVWCLLSREPLRIPA